MPVIFASNHIIDFTVTGGTVVNESTAEVDSDFSASSLQVDGNGGSSLVASLPSTESDIWISFTLQPVTTGGAGTPFVVFREGATEFARLYYKDGTDKLVLQTKIATVWTDLFTIGWFFDTAVSQRIAIHFSVSETTGIIAVYKAGTLVGSSSSALDTTGDLTITGCDTIEFWAPSDSAANDFYYSEICVSDEDCRDWRVFSKPVNGAGSNSDFTGAYTDVDDLTVDDNNFISSVNAANDISTFSLPDLPTGSWEGKAVAVSSRSRRGATGPQNIQHALRTQDVNYTAATQSLTTGFENKIQDLWLTNPNTGIGWTAGDINSLEVGVKSIA